MNDPEISDLYSTVATLEVENEKLLEQKSSPWKCFFYSDSTKQSFVIAELTRMQIPFRETENGLEAQECYVEQIRKIEKQYKPSANSHCDTLRELLDKAIMQSQNYDEVLQRLRESDCEVKCGKYLAVKVKYASNFIRTHQLGGEYSEMGIKNRINYKLRFENDVNNKIDSAVNPDSPEVMTLKTIRHYTVVFAAGHLPVRKVKKKLLFSWENCEELNKLAEINRKINNGVTLESLRNDFAVLEKSVIEKENQIAELKKAIVECLELYKKGERCFKYYSNNEFDLALLAQRELTADNYHKVLEVVTECQSEIAELEQSLPADRARLKDTVDTLDTLEKVMGSTYIQSLIDLEKERRQSYHIMNGLKDSPYNQVAENVATYSFSKKK
jgi:hypothetical protein